MINRHATANEFSALMEQYGLRSNEGAQLAGEILNFSGKTVQKFYSQGLRRNDFELLKIKLSQRVADNKKPAGAG